MKLHNLYLTILTSLLLLSCTGRQDEGYGARDTSQDPCEVQFWTDNAPELSIGETRSCVASDGLSVAWEDGDHIALWAWPVSDGGTVSSTPALAAQDFAIYGRTARRAFFSSTLAAPMAEGRYLYWAVSPSPRSISGGMAAFSIPALQDGKGQGIMMSRPMTAAALVPMAQYDRDDKFQLSMSQALHLLRFYVTDPDNLLEGESVERIELHFPDGVSGEFRQPVPLPDGDTLPVLSPELVSGSGELVLEPETPLPISDDASRSYAYAAVFPRRWGPDDSFSARLYSQTKVALVSDLPLRAKDMKAGHATAVRLSPDAIRSYCRIFINFRSNAIGEDIQSIILTAPSGCKWSDNGSNTRILSTGSDIKPGETFLLEYENAASFRSLSRKDITVTYDSEHLTCTQTLKMPDLSDTYAATLDLDVAPLLLEDFSTVPSFSSNDEYSLGFITGAKDPHPFLNGWAGARCGAKAGVGVRLACRRETSADYDARMESAPLACTIKKAVDLKLSFDYGCGGMGSYIELLGKKITISDPVGQTVKVGYITSTDNYASNSTTGTYEHSFHIDAQEHAVEGGYENISQTKTLVLHAVPAGTSVIRISWRTVIDHKAGTHNNTDWLYMDNVSVSVNR